jgi:hypothetical protein
LSKPVNTKAAPPVSLNRLPPAPGDSSDQAQALQEIQNLKLRKQGIQQSLLKAPVPVPTSEETPARRQEEQTAEIIQLLQRIAVATETLARGVDQQHKQQ